MTILHRAALLSLALLTALSPAVVGQEEDPIELLADRPIRSTIPDWQETWWRSFVIDVPADAVYVKIVVEDAPIDLDVFARHDQPMSTLEDYDGADVNRATSEQFNDVLWIGRTSEPPLATGRYYVDVAYTLDEEPSVGKRAYLEKIPFTIRAHFVRTRVDGDLVPGKPIRSRTDPDEGWFRTFKVDVPPGTRHLRIDLDDVHSDLDIMVRKGDQMLTADDADGVADTALARETLLLDDASDPPLSAGVWYVNVYDPIGVGSVPFTIHLAFSAEPPPAIVDLKVLREPRDALDRAILCTVELTGPEGGGSGSLLTPDGLILTNHHVVATADGGVVADGELVVGITTDERLPALEAFRARVIESDERLDLALVEIVSTLHGRPVPADYRFPSIEMGDPDALRIGDAIYIVGYPAAGGSGSRVSINLTLGILSGFDNTDVGLVFKTDADISSGNSGGAALDAKMRLVGVPTYVVPESDGNAQMGYVHTLDMLPDSWRKRIQGRRR